MGERASAWATAEGEKEAGAGAMTADIRTAAQRDCVNCGKTYEPTDDGQRFCQNLCKRQNYHERRYGKEHADYWLKCQIAKFERSSTTRVIPTDEQIAEVMYAHNLDELLLGNGSEWLWYTAACSCGWRSEQYEFPGDAHKIHAAHVAAHVSKLMAGLAEGEAT